MSPLEGLSFRVGACWGELTRELSESRRAAVQKKQWTRRLCGCTALCARGNTDKVFFSFFFLFKDRNKTPHRQFQVRSEAIKGRICREIYCPVVLSAHSHTFKTARGVRGYFYCRGLLRSWATWKSLRGAHTRQPVRCCKTSTRRMQKLFDHRFKKKKKRTTTSESAARLPGCEPSVRYCHLLHEMAMMLAWFQSDWSVLHRGRCYIITTCCILHDLDGDDGD